MVTVRCQKCGDEFETYPSRVKAGRSKYCSRKCWANRGNPVVGSLSRRAQKRKARELNGLVDDVTNDTVLVYDPTDSFPVGWGRYEFHEFRDSLVAGVWPDGSVWRVQGVGDVIVEGRKVRPLGQRRDRFFYQRQSGSKAIVSDREGRTSLAA